MLAFISRRLEFGSIVLIATVRDDVPSPFHDPATTVLELAPPTEPDSRKVLTAVARELGSHAQRRILTVAAVALPSATAMGAAPLKGLLACVFP